MWTYPYLRGIPPHLAQPRIELNTNIPTSHQVWYWMNHNYTSYEVGFGQAASCEIHHFSGGGNLALSHCGGTKKNVKLEICEDFQKLNIATKKDH